MEPFDELGPFAREGVVGVWVIHPSPPRVRTHTVGKIYCIRELLAFPVAQGECGFVLARTQEEQFFLFFVLQGSGVLFAQELFGESYSSSCGESSKAWTPQCHLDEKSSTKGFP